MNHALRPTRGERFLAWGWAGLLLGCAFLLASILSQGKVPDTRITALLPETRQTALLGQAEQRLTQAFEDRFVLLVSGERPEQLVAELKARLSHSTSVLEFDGDELAYFDTALAPYRYRLLSASLFSTSDEAWLQRGLRRLYTPGHEVDLLKDPFGLLDSWLAHQLDSPIQLVNGLPAVSDSNETWFLVSGRLAASPYDMDLQHRFSDAIANFQTAHPEAQLLRSGLVFHATAGANQAKREITVIGLGSLLGIGLLLWVTFRRGTVLISLLLPIACGVLFALPLTWWTFGTLNLLTLAFGASLIGVAVDYALHLQSARQLDPQLPLSRLWPGLLLALASSLAAYLAQLATPLPGLRQMGTFAILGLIGAWLTVRLWLPWFSPRPHSATQHIATQLERLQVPPQARYRWGLLILCGLCAGILIVTRLSVNDDLRQLSSSPPALLSEQRHVQTMLAPPMGSHYLVVTAEDEAGLLERLEELEASLAELQRQGHLTHYRHLAQAVPSPATQQANLIRVQQAYEAVLPEFIATAGLPATMLESIRESLHKVPQLTPEDWLAMRGGHADRMLWLDEIPTLDDPGFTLAALVTLGDADDVARQEFKRLTTQTDIHYQDRVLRLSEHLAQLREQITQWLVVAVVLLALLFVWRYRYLAWRVLLPPLGALIVTLALFSALNIGLTLFHVLGLLLVLGIGLDAGIFSTEHPDSPAAWLAITLSCASSLLAFGLLAFSATPALHALGLTCLVGLTTAWALVPFARADTRHLFTPHDSPQ